MRCVPRELQQQVLTTLHYGLLPDGYLFLGSSEAVAEIIRMIFERPQLGLQPIGFLDNDQRAGPKLSGSPRLGTIAEAIHDGDPHVRG